VAAAVEAVAPAGAQPRKVPAAHAPRTPGNEENCADARPEHECRLAPTGAPAKTQNLKPAEYAADPTGVAHDQTAIAETAGPRAASADKSQRTNRKLAPSVRHRRPGVGPPGPEEQFFQPVLLSAAGFARTLQTDAVMRDSPAGPSVPGVGSDSAASGTAETPLREVCSGGEAEPAGALATDQSVQPPGREDVSLQERTLARANPTRSR